MAAIRKYVLLIASAAAAWSADESAAKQTPAPAEDAIAVAKREFDAVKAARSTPELAPASLPTFSTPALQVGGETAPSVLKRPDDRAAAKKKSANWLVDAMKESESKGPGARSTRDELMVDGLRAKEKAEDSPRQDRPKPTERKQLETTSNPLDRYMESWMTPQDLALLKPVLRADRTDAAGADGLLKIPTLADTGRGYFNRRDGFGSASEQLPSRAGSERENPYLAALGASSPANPAGVQPAPGAQPPPPPTAARASMQSPAVPTTGELSTPAKATTPSFVKPREDEKFNKQMKRF